MKRAVSTLLWAVCYLLTLGVVMMTSLTGHLAHTPSDTPCAVAWLVPNHMIWIGIGLVLMGAVSCVDYRRWRQFATPFSGAVFLLLILALIPGMRPAFEGARRWLYLGPWGVIQPSILAGGALVLFMAWWYQAKDLRSRYLSWIPFAILGFMMCLIFVEPDVTTALLIALAGAVMMILGGEKIIYVALCAAGTISGLIWQILRDPMNVARISDLFMYVRAETASQPVYTQALASGGWFGVGLGQGRWVGYFLPEAGGEFMSAFIGEELGLAVLLTMSALYIAIAVSGVYIGAKASDRFGTLLAFGIVSLMVIPVLLNFLILATPMCFHFPLLPFVSGGGLNLCMSLIGVGVLVNIARTSGGKDCHETGMPAKASDSASPRSA